MSVRPHELAVLGGSFDPPHLGHVLIPTYLFARGLADAVLVAPSYEHPLDKELGPFEQRLAWTRAAMSVHDSRVEVTDLERDLWVEHRRPSYMVEFLRELRRRRPEERIRLVVGSDIIESGETSRWEAWPEIERDYEPIVVPRAGHAPKEYAVLPEISSTQVRGWLREPDAPGVREALRANVPASLLHMLEAPTRAVTILGRGNVGTHAAAWLSADGVSVAQHPGRGPWPKEAFDWGEAETAGVWLLVPDGELGNVAAALVAAGLPQGTPVLHGAGAKPSRVALASLAKAGYPVGTLHPICSLRKEHPSRTLARASFGIEGDAPAREFAEALVGQQPWLDLQALDQDARTAYHAACALAANHMAVIQSTAAEVLVGQGLAPDIVDEALSHLMRSSLENLSALGIPDGISGPAVRGETSALRAHVAALPDSAATLYAELSERLVALVNATR